MKRLELLDYARFFAVLIVILFHYTYNGIANGKISSINHIPALIELTKYGYVGVDLFFMISGFVIFYSAKNRTASQFAVARGVRLYPAYWFAVIFTSCFAVFWGGELMQVQLPQIIANFTMIQSVLGFSNVDGVYWTLWFEIQFYFAVFMMLFFGMRKYMDSLFIIWPYLMVLTALLNVSVPYMNGYFSYFSAGALFALMKEKPKWSVFTALIISYLLSIKFAMNMALSKTQATSEFFSEYVVASIITFFFLIFIIQNLRISQNLKLPKSKILGALTYPIYLIHAHFGYMFISRFATNENKITVYFITVLIVISIAYAMHQVIEISFKETWKNLFNKIIGDPVDKANLLVKKILKIK